MSSLDEQGLRNTYMTLGQIAETLRMHQEDAEERGESKRVSDLHDAHDAVTRAQVSVKEALDA